ncbi:MAG: hypothetical protein HN356_00455 [Calditrichaeota bacterium]|nr:hypothetical protein [Calditrichota bacterium]MBT7616179.1 hypothetical protein [Calditrichota bacterium]MBT7787644.1 hypothetical protein [Calditrichota bacterium]
MIEKVEIPKQPKITTIDGLPLTVPGETSIEAVDLIPSYVEPTQPLTEEEARLDWLINDFEGITENVYEAIMISAIRARQIGRRQKQEIDAYNSTIEATEIVNPDDEGAEEPGLDHFHHIKPTIKALRELKEQDIKFYYLDNDKK